ncbi:MAG: LacI family DNA-binding transcriptional regulator [Verrucomicrobia bacterium]|nr:LacI family DNA-binding transcriptional regulator [Verrucomicrobiota bacterium]
MTNSFPRVSIHEIARRARVSATTVSLVINSKGSISTRTRERVMALC